MFLIFINDLPDNIRSTRNIFENYASLFTHILDKKTSQDELNLWFTKAIGLFNEKYVGHTLDERLNFTEYITSKTSKCDKLTGISKNCQSSFKWMYWYCHDKAKTSVICKQNRTRLNIELVPFKGRLWGREGGGTLCCELGLQSLTGFWTCRF